LTAGEDVLCYDFPSPIMMSIYRRLRVPVLGRHVRYLRLLRTNAKVRNFVKHESVANCLSHIGNWALTFRQTMPSIPEGIEFSMRDREFGKEFDTINSQPPSLHAVSGSRSAEYL